MNYKNLLLKYLTGNLSKEDKKNTLNYDELTTNDSDISIASFFNILGNIQCKDSNGTLNGKTIIYGNATQDYNLGFIALFKGNELIYVATQYNTGTPLGKFKYLDVDENGNYYGIDEVDGRYRFILLNNVSELKTDGSEQIVLRNSYYLQGNLVNLDNNFTEIYVKKSIQSASYMIIASDTNHLTIKACLFKINVGESNEWIDFTTSISFTDVLNLTYENCYVYFDKEDNPFIEYYGLIDTTDDKTKLVIYTNTDTTLGNEEVIYDNVKRLVSANEGVFYGASTLMPVGSKHFYVFLSNVESQATAVLLEYVSETTHTMFYKISPNSGNFDFTPEAFLFNINNIPIIYYIFPIESSSQTYAGEAEQRMGIVSDKINLIKQLPNLLTEGDIQNQIVLINNSFNMFELSSVYYILNNDTPRQKITTWTFVYNPQNYNNEPYENTNSLVGNNSMLFDANNNLIFARNLYNYKVYNNRVISTLNVPNTYLNDTTIDKQLLLSETNSTILEDTISITKNIYEDLYINDFITLVMENQNEDISIENKAGAIRITQSAFKTNDYESAKATKMKINYSDGSFFVTSTSGDINNDVATYNINLYAPTNKDILTIDILSEDETITYQTITNETISKLNLIGGKYYHISQDVHIE